MLSPDQIRVRRRADRLFLQPLEGAARTRALELASDIVGVLETSLGASEEDVRQELSFLPHAASEAKLVAGLIKVALDASDFELGSELDAASLRQNVFSRASEVRASLEDSGILSREAIFADVSRELELEPSVLEAALFSDLKGAAELTKRPDLSGPALVAAYEVASLQGILLRATELILDIEGIDSVRVRAFFRQLKFRELLFSLEDLEQGGHRVTVSGPLSVFGPKTRYGLRLALLIPAIAALGVVKCAALLRWGTEKRALRFEWLSTTNESGSSAGIELAPLRAELEQLSLSPAFIGSGWVMAPTERLFSVPGLGVCVPDVVCRRAGSAEVYLELLGYWSRDAVFRRVEWAQKLPDSRFIFLVPSRLRVSEAILPEHIEARLHIFKATPNARRLVQELEALGACA